MDALSPLFTHPGDLVEPIGGFLPAAFAIAALVICAIALVRGRLRSTVLEAGIVFLPLVAVALGNAVLMERSKATDFCTSCHVMMPIQESAEADDGSLASFHVARGTVPGSQSCYTCHSGYGLLGDMSAKIAGVNHMIHTLRASYDLPLKLRAGFDIDSCLECHAETRSFRAVDAHQVPDIQEALLEREMACTGACHPPAHPPEALMGAVAEEGP